MISRQKYFVSVARAARLGAAKSHGNGAQFLGRMHRASALSVLHRIYRPGPCTLHRSTVRKILHRSGPKILLVLSVYKLEILCLIGSDILHRSEVKILLVLSVYKLEILCLMTLVILHRNIF